MLKFVLLNCEVEIGFVVSSTRNESLKIGRFKEGSRGVEEALYLGCRHRCHDDTMLTRPRSRLEGDKLHVENLSSSNYFYCATGLR